MDDGIVRVPAHYKGEMCEKLCRIRDIDPANVVSVGDNHTDLSMQIEGSRFVGFNPSKQIAYDGFEAAGVPVIEGNDCRDLWPYFYPGEELSKSEQ